MQSKRIHSALVLAASSVLAVAGPAKAQQIDLIVSISAGASGDDVGTEEEARIMIGRAIGEVTANQRGAIEKFNRPNN